MKKHNEGYALPFVLVVFLVITLVATAILTVSLRNLQSQKASIQRMEEQYVAQGEIEKVEAGIRNTLKIHNNTIGEAALDADIRPVLDEQNTSITLTYDESNQKLTVSAVSQSNTLQISAVISIAGTKIEDKGSNSYLITDPVIAYDSYTITTVDPGTEDGGATE